jgi:hypothetical protein
MRILRGVSSRLLPCGCLAGVYETYASEIIGILDARGAECADPSHQPGHTLTLTEMNGLAEAGAPVPLARTPHS